MPAEVLPILPALLRRAHLAALDRAVDHVQALLESPAVWAEAAALYHRPVADADALSELLADCNAQPEFLSLLLWDGCPGQPQPVGAELLANTTDLWQRKVLQSLLDSPPQCWVVARVVADTVCVRALGQRQVVQIQEPLLAAAVQPGDLWLGRVVTVQGVSVLDAVHAWLPAATLPAMKRAAPAIRALPRAKQLYGWLVQAGQACQRLEAQQRRLRQPLALTAEHWHLGIDAWSQGIAPFLANGHAVALTSQEVVLRPPHLLAGVQLRHVGDTLTVQTWQEGRTEAVRALVAQHWPMARRLWPAMTDAATLLQREAVAPWTPRALQPLAESWLAEQWHGPGRNWTQRAKEPKQARAVTAWLAQLRVVSRWASVEWQVQVEQWSRQVRAELHQPEGPRQRQHLR